MSLSFSYREIYQTMQNFQHAIQKPDTALVTKSDFDQIVNQLEQKSITQSSLLTGMTEYLGIFDGRISQKFIHSQQLPNQPKLDPQYFYDRYNLETGTIAKPYNYHDLRAALEDVPLDFYINDDRFA